MPKRSSVKFDKNTADRCKPKDKRYEVWASNKPGLFLRVWPTGTKRYYVALDRKTTRKLGDASVKTLTWAWNKAKSLQGKFADGEIIDSDRSDCPTLKKFIDGKYRTYARTNYKTPERGDQVANRIIKALECDSTILHKRLDKIAELDVQRWRRKRARKVKSTTMKRDLGALRTALNCAIRPYGYIGNNPTEGVNVKVEDDKRVRFLSENERKRLLTALEERDKKWQAARANNEENRRKRGMKVLPAGEFKDYLTPLTILTMNTGLRRSEALGLTWDEVVLTRDPRLTVKAAMSKTSKTRHIPLNKTAVDILKRWRKQEGSEGPVFKHPATGERLNKAHRAWKKLMKDAEIEDFRFHDLRHDFASQLVMKGQPLYVVKELLGHGSIEMTERYAHLAEDAKAKAVEVLS
jgi:integrase